jgi:deoxycytidylate deaminase
MHPLQDTRHSNQCLLLCSYHATCGCRYVVHAEANALLNTNTSNIAGATIYVTMMPCNNCAKLLIQAGIAEVVYFEVCESLSAMHHPTLSVS